MARRKGFDYFNSFELLANAALNAADILREIVLDYNFDNLEKKSEDIHQIERDADEVVKETMKELYVSFITPIDREDIVNLVEKLDNIIDSINGLTYEFYYLNVEKMRPNTVEYINLIEQGVASVQEAVKEFSRFKNSKQLDQKIDEANAIESKGDLMYTNELADLFRNEQDPIEVIRWQKVYFSFEKVLDSCEDAADIMTSIVIKNS